MYDGGYLSMTLEMAKIISFTATLAEPSLIFLDAAFSTLSEVTLVILVSLAGVIHQSVTLVTLEAGIKSGYQVE